jgi:hypothetical protein
LKEQEREAARESLKQIAESDGSATERGRAQTTLIELGVRLVNDGEPEVQSDPARFDAGPSLKKLLPHRFPDQPQRAYYRTRAFLSEIPLSGLATQLLRDCQLATMADVEQTIFCRKEYAAHRHATQLQALWLAAEAVKDCEYMVDFAEDWNESFLQLRLKTELSGEALADLLFNSLAESKAEYARLAANVDAQ